MLAAERLAELAGLPPSELLEMLLLELVASGEVAEAAVPEKRPRSRSVGPRGPARVIPIAGRRRRRAPMPAPLVQPLAERPRAARIRGDAAHPAAARRGSQTPLDSHGLD